MTEMGEFFALVARLEVAAKEVLEQGLKCDTRLELEDSITALDKWAKDN